MARKQPEQVSADALTGAYYEAARLVRGLAECSAYEGDVSAVHALVTEERRLMNAARNLERRYGHLLERPMQY